MTVQVLSLQSENAQCGTESGAARQLWECLLWGLRRGQWARMTRGGSGRPGTGRACRLPPSPRSKQEAKSRGASRPRTLCTKVWRLDQKALKWCARRPERPVTCFLPSWARVAAPALDPHCPDSRALLLPIRFPDLLICIPLLPLPGLRLDFRPCFPKASLPPPSPSPSPQGVASASITKPGDKKCGPLIKIM